MGRNRKMKKKTDLGQDVFMYFLKRKCKLNITGEVKKKVKKNTNKEQSLNRYLDKRTEI
jgi:hypothetical protein